MTVDELQRATTDSLLPGSSEAIRIQLVPPRAVINVRGRQEDADFVAAFKSVIGVGLPVESNGWAGKHDRAAIWLGPDEWLVTATDGEATSLEASIRAALPEDPWLSVVDLSHSYTIFQVAGSRTRDLLAKGCPLDLHPQVFTAGRCAQTILAKANVLLRAVDDAGAVEIWLRNSFADYTARWLVDAAAESSNY